MKRILPILLLIIGLTSFVQAQWTSPGTGNDYTLPDLVNVTGGVVTDQGDGKFSINANLTISGTDRLVIDNQVVRIDIPGALVTLQGYLSCTNTQRVKIYGTMTAHYGIRLENALGCDFRNLYLSDGGGIQVVESNATFTDVKFVYFTTDYCSSVINIFNSSPLIENCYFLLNDGPAVSSPANGQSSPTILNCSLDSNSNNSTNPQINLGPGGADTIRIVNNTIDGTYATSHVGAISISDLVGIGDTKVLMKGNIFLKGRYGYNQQGQTISSKIIDNQFINNDQETNPMNGGSGISIYGSSTNCKAILRNNIITGNLWGITAINLHQIDMGTERDWGNNVIHDNGNGGQIYDLYNNSACDLTAVGNNWGTSNQRLIEAHIYHQPDNPAFGLVTYVPFIDVDDVDELILDHTPIDLTKAVVYNLVGQRVNPNALKPGIYLVETGQGSSRTVKKIHIQ